MKSFHVSRKSSASNKDMSDQELFYHTRRLFKSNRKMVKDLINREFNNNDSRTQASYNITPKRQTASSFHQNNNNNNNSSNLNKGENIIDNLMSGDNNQFLEQSFDKYFTSSACKFDAMRETEYLKSRKRFLPKKYQEISPQKDNYMINDDNQDLKQSNIGIDPNYNNNKQLSLSLNESLINQQEEQPWKKIYPRIKKCDFVNRTQRPPLFYIPPHIQRDDQRRYANFQLMKKRPNNTMSIQSKKWRDYKVFECPLVDQIYDDSYKCYTDIIYKSTSMKCKFDTSKQTVTPRQFFHKKHKSNMAASDLDAQKVLKAKDTFSVYRKNGIVDIDKITGREYKGIMPQNLVKHNENIYAHQQAPRTAPGRFRSQSNKK